MAMLGYGLVNFRWEKPNAADAIPKRCAGEGPNGNPKASSTLTPKALSVSTQQRPGAGRWEKKYRRLDIPGQKKLNRCWS